MIFACDDVFPVTLGKMRSAEVEVSSLGPDLELLLVFEDWFNIEQESGPQQVVGVLWLELTFHVTSHLHRLRRQLMRDPFDQRRLSAETAGFVLGV